MTSEFCGVDLWKPVFEELGRGHCTPCGTELKLLLVRELAVPFWPKALGDKFVLVLCDDIAPVLEYTLLDDSSLDFGGGIIEFGFLVFILRPL